MIKKDGILPVPPPFDKISAVMHQRQNICAAPCGGMEIIMTENKLCSSSRDLVCIEASRVLDSCRDRDCFEDARVYLTDFGEELIEHTGNVRVKKAKISHTCISVDPVQFNRGFYAVNIKFYVNVRFEACVQGRTEECEGVAVLEKKVILFGGESGVSTYSGGTSGGFCCTDDDKSTNENVGPRATVDVAAPVVLGAKVVERREYSSCGCGCCLCVDEIPDCACRGLGSPLSRRDECERVLVVSLGLFSVVRLTRPGQYLVSATEYSVPDKECVCDEEKNPCCLFRSLDFPTEEFSLGTFGSPRSDKNCSCRDKY